MSLSKVELKSQLKNLGIKIEGNFVKRSDITKALVVSVLTEILKY